MEAITKSRLKIMGGCLIVSLVRSLSLATLAHSVGYVALVYTAVKDNVPIMQALDANHLEFEFLWLCFLLLTPFSIVYEFFRYRKIEKSARERALYYKSLEDVIDAKILELDEKRKEEMKYVC